MTSRTCPCGAPAQPFAGIGQPPKFCSQECRAKAHTQAQARYRLRASETRSRERAEERARLLVSDEVPCTQCRQVLPRSAYTSGRSRYGLHSWCRDCVRAYRQGRRERDRALYRQYKYGVSPEAQVAMFVAQQARCAACSGELDGGRATHLDHDHATGRVRAFLCEPCNHVIGAALEDADRLRACAEYLNRHGEVAA